MTNFICWHWEITQSGASQYFWEKHLSQSYRPGLQTLCMSQNDESQGSKLGPMENQELILEPIFQRMREPIACSLRVSASFSNLHHKILILMQNSTIYCIYFFHFIPQTYNPRDSNDYFILCSFLIRLSFRIRVPPFLMVRALTSSSFSNT